uniref:B3 domain-containing protein n=1 Tax=Triticum urartu TaxID=4572 RepID=A0A8R7PKR9_TRIUA
MAPRNLQCFFLLFHRDDLFECLYLCFSLRSFFLTILFNPVCPVFLFFLKIIPCTVRDSLSHIAGGFFSFRAHGRRYSLDVLSGSETTVMGGDDWVKFVSDYHLGGGELVVFDTSRRMAKAYVCYVGCMRVANDGGPAEHTIVDEDAGDQGAAAGGINIGSDDEALNDVHEEVAAPLVVFTKGIVLSYDEVSKLDLVLTNNDGYIGCPFVHRLTTTNVVSKQMKIPRKVIEGLNLLPEGVVGICFEAEDYMNVGYRQDRGGRMVFSKQWGVFATQNNLQEGDGVVFNFKPSNQGGVNITCVVDNLRTTT